MDLFFEEHVLLFYKRKHGLFLVLNNRWFVLWKDTHCLYTFDALFSNKSVTYKNYNVSISRKLKLSHGQYITNYTQLH